MNDKRFFFWKLDINRYDIVNRGTIDKFYYKDIDKRHDVDITYFKRLNKYCIIYFSKDISKRFNTLDEMEIYIYNYIIKKSIK
jgi:hypothetical protein